MSCPPHLLPSPPPFSYACLRLACVRFFHSRVHLLTYTCWLCSPLAGFAVHKRAYLQGQARRRRQQKAAACKQAWVAAHRDLSLQHAAAALLRQPRREPPRPESTADKLVDVELRAFNASIEAGVIAPPQTLADLRAHPVVKSYD